MPTLEFWLDFGSPNAYLAYHHVLEIEEKHSIRFTLKPALLGGIFKATGNSAPMIAFAGVPAKLQYTMHEMQRYVRHRGLNNFQMNPHFPVNTLLAMRGAMAAINRDELQPYVKAVLSGMWEQGLKMDDPTVWANCLTDAGMDAAAYGELVQSAPIKQALVAATEEAVGKGIFGIPTFFVGEEMFFGKDSLPALERELELTGNHSRHTTN